MTPQQLPHDAQATLEHLIERLRPLRDGEPQKPHGAGPDADGLALAVCTTGGEETAAGDADLPIPLQSMSKPFIYGLALDTLGREAVLRKCNVEPTGEAFNSISELEEDRLPYNPMINSGAITMSALLHHADPGGACARMLDMFGAYLGGEARLDDAMVDRQLDASHRNRAIAHLLRHFEVIGDDIDGALALYVSQCSVLATTRELARMAATLAHGGVHPLTGRRALEHRHVRDVLSVMFTCGMYDASGTWAFHVGLPAKSGVSGGIIAVAPGRMGLAAWSPRLNPHGNSVRAGAALKELATRWRLGLFDR
ncbi:glutaminase A [Ramlibacter sp. AN1015]|uniref:glutaminase A n=1 Tax=Ramlibacter sp. AN1015 TaxID=3133428 RepID=UPI0030C5E15B